MVFYRKYRPQTIEELDSKDVREKLYSVLSSEDISHAFLFTGPKGLGKTSTARIVAKVVNCEQNSKLKTQKSKLQLKTQKLETELTKDSIEPCNKCYQCVSITNGTNIDVLEIDGASNRGIDEIRDLREKVRLSPASAKKKVYIIDEVHMLTTEAFNALLKTLEEPPNHVIFILCTTEAQKVPQTIVSRCFHIPFKKAEALELVRSFTRIVKKEKLDIDEDALNLIAGLSDGSFRDGVKVLEEIVLVGQGKKITKELVEEKYKISSINHQVSEMITYLAKKDAKSGLELTSKLVDEGVEMKYFIEQLISQLHEALLVEAGVGTIGQKMENGKWKMEDIRNLVELLVKAHMELKYAVLPQLPLEMAIVEWGEFKRHSGNQASPEHPESVLSKVELRDSGVASLPRMTGRETSNTDNFWQELIGKVKLHNHSIAGILRGCALKEYNGKNVIIETKYKFHKERLDEEKTRQILEEACKEISGRGVSVSVLLK